MEFPILLVIVPGASSFRVEFSTLASDTESVTAFTDADASREAGVEFRRTDFAAL
ncbi:MAG: hypothetical protein ABR963_01045 [Acidimicrobiales bacterium]|jgi:hypothetical protein